MKTEPRTVNAAWHKSHPMPMHSTLDQRVSWHIAHLKHCRCRKDLPKTILAGIKARGKKVCSRGHVFDAPGTCPVCWPGKKKTSTGKRN